MCTNCQGVSCTPCKIFLLLFPVMAGWGELVRVARESAGLNKAELADRIGMSPSMISRIEAERAFIEPDVFRRLCQELRALSPVQVLNALGYEVTVPGADRLPRGIVQDLLSLSPEVLAGTALLIAQAAQGNPRVARHP